jgi:predicted nucleic acid-binding protein
MTSPVLVDANVPMYAVGTAHPLKRPCVDFLNAVARGEIVALTDAEVLQEILHRYSALGQRGRAIQVVQLFVKVVPVVFTNYVCRYNRSIEYP